VEATTDGTVDGAVSGAASPAAPGAPPARTPGQRLGGRVWLWLAFAVAHLALTVVGVGLIRESVFYDVELYRFWVWDGLAYGWWPVLDAAWVYPIGALAPMLAVAPWAGSPVAYALAWAALVTALDAGALAVLLRTQRRGEVGAWWWLGATLALGPVTLGRLDGLIAPLTVTALAVAATRPRVATVLLTAGAWIKVAPGAIVLALASTARRPLRDVLLPAAAASAVVIALALALGSGSRVLGFLLEQGERGLQVEAVGATPYSLARLVNPQIEAYLNPDLNTFEIAGPGSGAVTTALDVLLLLAVAAIVGLAWRAARRGADGVGGVAAAAGAIRSVEALLLAALALELALIVFNKVGSPQYLAWLLPPVAVALARSGWAGAWRTPAVVVLVACGLTQWMFPWAYIPFLLAWPPIVVVAAARNVLLVALLGWAVARLWRTR